jgi:hypothetical protein
MLDPPWRRPVGHLAHQPVRSASAIRHASTCGPTSSSHHLLAPHRRPTGPPSSSWCQPRHPSHHLSMLDPPWRRPVGHLAHPSVRSASAIRHTPTCGPAASSHHLLGLIAAVYLVPASPSVTPSFYVGSTSAPTDSPPCPSPVRSASASASPLLGCSSPPLPPAPADGPSCPALPSCALQIGPSSCLHK